MGFTVISREQYYRLQRSLHATRNSLLREIAREKEKLAAVTEIHLRALRLSKMHPDNNISREKTLIKELTQWHSKASLKLILIIIRRIFLSRNKNNYEFEKCNKNTNISYQFLWAYNILWENNFSLAHVINSPHRGKMCVDAEINLFRFEYQKQFGSRLPKKDWRFPSEWKRITSRGWILGIYEPSPLARNDQGY